MNEIKLPEEVLTQIQELSNSYKALTYDLGQLELETLKLESYKTEITKKFNNLQIKESDYLKELHVKYGEGTLDLDKKTFIPTKK